MSPFVYPSVLTDEQKAERRRQRQQEERLETARSIGRALGALTILVVLGAGLLYLAVRVVRLAWGGP